jgi:hypothetical protein
MRYEVLDSRHLLSSVWYVFGAEFIGEDGPVESVEVGDEVTLQVSVEDVRDIPLGLYGVELHVGVVDRLFDIAVGELTEKLAIFRQEDQSVRDGLERWFGSGATFKGEAFERWYDGDLGDYVGASGEEVVAEVKLRAVEAGRMEPIGEEVGFWAQLGQVGYRPETLGPQLPWGMHIEWNPMPSIDVLVERTPEREKILEAIDEFFIYSVSKLYREDLDPNRDGVLDFGDFGEWYMMLVGAQ